MVSLTDVGGFSCGTEWEPVCSHALPSAKGSSSSHPQPSPVSTRQCLRTRNVWCDFLNIRFVMGLKCVLGSVDILLPSHRPFLVILQPPRSPPDLAKKTPWRHACTRRNAGETTPDSTLLFFSGSRTCVRKTGNNSRGTDIPFFHVGCHLRA